MLEKKNKIYWVCLIIGEVNSMIMIGIVIIRRRLEDQQNRVVGDCGNIHVIVHEQSDPEPHTVPQPIPRDTGDHHTGGPTEYKIAQFLQLWAADPQIEYTGGQLDEVMVGIVHKMEVQQAQAGYCLWEVHGFRVVDC